MCGIVGYSRTRKEARNDRERFIALCREACIRGEHAYGIAYITPDDRLEVFKDTDKERVLEAIPQTMPERIIFHNRYSTSGDWKQPDNNQPIHVGESALVFNGTIDMGTKDEMQKRYGISMLTDNDGEIVMNDILHDQPFAHIRDGQTFAGIYLDRRRMFAFRNDLRPLKRIKDEGCEFVCSTKDIALRAKFDENYIEDITPFTLTFL